MTTETNPAAVLEAAEAALAAAVANHQRLAAESQAAANAAAVAAGVRQELLEKVAAGYSGITADQLPAADAAARDVLAASDLAAAVASAAKPAVVQASGAVLLAKAALLRSKYDVAIDTRLLAAMRVDAVRVELDSALHDLDTAGQDLMDAHRAARAHDIDIRDERNPPGGIEGMRRENWPLTNVPERIGASRFLAILLVENSASRDVRRDFNFNACSVRNPIALSEAHQHRRELPSLPQAAE